MKRRLTYGPIDAVRDFANRKMIADFQNSRLDSPSGLSRDRDTVHKILVAAEIQKKDRMKLLFREHSTRTAAYNGLVSNVALKLLGGFLQSNGPLVVSTSTISVGLMSALRSLQLRHKAFGFDHALEVQFQDVNSRDQMRSLNQQGPVPDFIIASDGAFFMNNAPVHNEYQFLMPFYVEDQYILRRKDYHRSSTGKIWVYPLSSAEAMIRAWMSKKKAGGVDPKPWLTGMKIEYCEARDLPKIAFQLDRPDMLVAWEPLVSELKRQSLLRSKETPSQQALEQFPDSWFPCVFSLSAHQRWATKDRESLRNAFEEILTAEWNYCRVRPAYAWKLIEHDFDFLQFFAAGSGCEISTIIEQVPTERKIRELGRAGDDARNVPGGKQSPGSQQEGSAENELPATLHLDTKRRVVKLGGCELNLSLSQFALVLTLSEKFTKDCDSAAQVTVIDALAAALGGLLSAVPNVQEHNARKMLLTLQKANKQHDTEPLSKLLNDLRRQVDRRRGDEKRAAQLLAAVLPKGRNCNLKLDRSNIVIE